MNKTITPCKGNFKPRIPAYDEASAGKQNRVPNHHQISIRHQTLWLLPQRAIFWEDESALILSDLHIGKSGHMRKHGIPVPEGIHQRDIDLLAGLIDNLLVREVLIVGDLFHSEHNLEWDLVKSVTLKYPDVRFRLVPGNHDILPADDYQNAGVDLTPLVYERGPFVFSHQPIDDLPGEMYCISGHIHPGVRLSGMGRQRVTLPCFAFGPLNALLPAFGRFTGLARISPTREDRIFAIAEGKVIDVSFKE